jgi:excisionase family DNA binding protein
MIMNEQRSRIDVKQAADLAECSTRHIQKIIKNGTLSAHKEKGNKHLIDKTDFYRVFPDLMPRTMATNLEQDSLLDVKQVAEFVGCSTRHIQKMIKGGVLSAYRDKGNKYLIDKSEFYRVFPDLKPRTSTETSEQEDNQLLFLKEQNEFLKEQLEYAHGEKKSLLSALENAQRMIEFKPQKRKKLFGIF